MQLTSFALLQIATDLVKVGEVFDPSKVWIEMDVAITPNGVNEAAADITAAPGSLAPRQEVTAWSAPYQSKNNLEVVDSGIHTWSPTTPADEATIVGWSIWDSAVGGNLLGYGFLAVPVFLAGPQNVLSFVLRLSIDPAGTWDVSMDWDD